MQGTVTQRVARFIKDAKRGFARNASVRPEKAVFCVIKGRRTHICAITAAYWHNNPEVKASELNAVDTSEFTNWFEEHYKLDSSTVVEAFDQANPKYLSKSQLRTVLYRETRKLSEKLFGCAIN